MRASYKSLVVFWLIGFAVVLTALVYEGGNLLSGIRKSRLAENHKEQSDNYQATVLANFPLHPSERDLEILSAAYRGPQAAWPNPHLFPSMRILEFSPLVITPALQGSDQEKARLGFALFTDPMLSSSGQIACQSCHNRELGWGDGLRSSFGHDRLRGSRNAPSLFSAAYRPALFWDGRARTLEEQALMPLRDPKEMANHDLDMVVRKLSNRADYRRQFKAVYQSENIRIEQVADALATFQRTLEQPTRLDRFLSGSGQALSREQIWGMHLFRTKAGCANCHNGPLLTDEKFHNLGLSLLARPREDVGRYRVTGHLLDVGRFRTPSLRHVSETAPYMHNGLIRDLRRVVIFYEVGGGKTRPRNDTERANPLMPYAAMTSPFLKPFALTENERSALIRFLEAL